MADHTKATLAWQAVNEGLPEDKADWPQTASVVPEGYVLVPVKITDEMCKAGYLAEDKLQNHCCDNRKELMRSFSEPRWTAMLAAAPQPTPTTSYQGNHATLTVKLLVKLQERCDELLKQRDELLSALVGYGHKFGCGKNAFGAECTCGIGALIASVKGGAE